MKFINMMILICLFLIGVNKAQSDDSLDACFSKFYGTYVKSGSLMYVTRSEKKDCSSCLRIAFYEAPEKSEEFKKAKKCFKEVYDESLKGQFPIVDVKFTCKGKQINVKTFHELGDKFFYNANNDVDKGWGYIKKFIKSMELNLSGTGAIRDTVTIENTCDVAYDLEKSKEMIKGFSADKLPPNGKKIKDNIYHFSNLASEVFSKVSTDKDKIDPAAWKKFTAENCSKQTE